MGTLKVIAKTNHAYLKEILKNHTEGLEFLEALIKNNESKLEEVRDREKVLIVKVDELENDLAICQNKLICCDICDEQIDFGIGTLHFKQPGNLRIQQVMERIASEYQVNSNRTELF